MGMCSILQKDQLDQMGEISIEELMGLWGMSKWSRTYEILWMGWWMNEWGHEWVEQWMNKWINGWMDGWMDECRNEPMSGY